MAITLYTAATPNNYKVLITLAALGLEYDHKLIDFSTGEQFQGEFAKLSEHHRVPVLIDGDQILNESVNIVEYLLETYDDSKKLFYPRGSSHYWKQNEFVLFHASTIGIFHDLGFTFGIVSPNKEALTTLTEALARYYGDVESQLVKSGSGFLIGDKLSLADIVAYPHSKLIESAGVDIEKLPHTKAWRSKIAEIAFVKEAYSKIK